MQSLQAKRARLRTPEAAHYCGISASLLNRLRVYGGCPAYSKISSIVSYDPDDLDAWLDAQRQWVRIMPNMSLAAYEISVALNGLPEPEWPELPFKELLRIAFRDRIIDREDHPVVKLLRGLT